MDDAGAPRMCMRAPPARCSPGSLALANERVGDCVEGIQAQGVPERSTPPLEVETCGQRTADQPGPLLDRQVGTGSRQLQPNSADSGAHAPQPHGEAGGRPGREHTVRGSTVILGAEDETPLSGVSGTGRPELSDDLQQVDTILGHPLATHAVDDPQKVSRRQVASLDERRQETDGLVYIRDHSNGLLSDHHFPLGHAPEGIQGIELPLQKTVTENPHG